MPKTQEKEDMRSISVRVSRYAPGLDNTGPGKAVPDYSEYQVPWSPGMSAMDVLDYIYQHLDGTLAYYDHAACALGACARCGARINGKPGLMCQTLVTGDVTLEPLAKGELLKDLVVDKKPAIKKPAIKKSAQKE